MFSLLAPAMKENFGMACSMERELSFLPMVACTKENGLKEQL